MISIPHVQIVFNRSYQIAAVKCRAAFFNFVSDAHAKGSGHRTLQIEIRYRFDVAITTIVDSMKYEKRERLRYRLATQPYPQISNISIPVRF